MTPKPRTQHDQHDPDRLETLFHQALELEGEARGEFLREACAGDDPLHTALEELLGAASRIDSHPGWNSDALKNEAIGSAGYDPGGTIDRYEIQDRLGAGGMGVVYRALRKDEQFSKLVALKIVQTEQPSLLERFHQERQILARLEHPNIARLLDVGTTGEGLPFLAMEFVEGEPLDRYLKAQKPGKREILQLFRKICAAVSCAHRNLIIHRDLKPANILVTADGEPKLLDFGIAKLIDDDKLTKTGAGAMTPEYASPEQIHGGAVTTSSDIYSLGVLLFEALDGTRPYRDTLNSVELARAITTEAPKHLKDADTDLENIVQMALRKEPERRYDSADQFSEDLRRYLEGFPVIARPATRAYRAAKFLKRNRILMGAAALLVIAIAGGVIATVRQARIAARRFDDVRQLANSYLFDVYDGIRDLPGATAVRQLVVKKALEYLDSLSKEQGGDVALGRELGSAYLRVANLQGEVGLPNLGDSKGALESYRKSLAIRQRVAAEAPGDAEIANELSESHAALGKMLTFHGSLQEASENLRKAVEISERLAASHPKEFKILDRLAVNYVFLGSVTGSNEVPNLGNWKGALELFGKAREVRERIMANDPSNQQSRFALSVIHNSLAGLDRTQGNDSAAVQEFLASITIDESLMKDNPVSQLYRREWSVDNRSLSLAYLALNKIPEARETGDRAAGGFERIATDDPKNVQAQAELADSYWSQGFVLEKANQPERAFERYEAAIAFYDKTMKEHPGSYPSGRRTAYQLVAGLSAKLGDVERAYKAAQKELEIDDHYLKLNGADQSAKNNRGVAMLQIGQAYEARAAKTSSKADWREALVWDQRSLDWWNELKKQGVLSPAYANFLDRAQKAVEKCKRALGV